MTQPSAAADSNAARAHNAGASARAWFERFGRFEADSAQRIVIAAAIALVLPAVFSGFALDDYVLLYQMAHPDGEWAGRAPFDLFRWMDPAHDRRLIDGAGLPWWTYPEARCAFFRPLSSLTHTLDRWLWPSSAIAMHLHSTLWFLLLLLLARRAYIALIDSRWVAGLATAMFALDSAHGETIGWISNRNALISGVFGIAALSFHHRLRSAADPAQGKRPRWVWGALACLCLGLSLSAAELSAATLGYLFAYALFYDRAAARVRFGSLALYAPIVLVWAWLRSAGNYGSFGLGGYVDPIAEPWAFLRALPERAVVLLSSQITRLGSDLYDLVPARLQPGMLLWAITACAGTLFIALPGLRRERAIRTFAAGALLSAVPIAATVPADRLLTFVGFGVMPLLAQLIHNVLRGAFAPQVEAVSRSSRLQASVAAGLLFVHFVIDPVMLPVLAFTPALVQQQADRAEASLSRAPEIQQRTVVVAEIPDSVMLSYLPVMRAFSGTPRPDKLYWLAATHTPARVERRGPNVLRVSAEGGLYDRRAEARGSDVAFRVGERVKLSHMSVEIVALTPDARPRVCDFVFGAPLESPAYLWVSWRDGALAPYAPPAWPGGA